MAWKMLSALAALALAGCTTASTKMIDDRTAIISGRGNAYASSADVAQRIMLEAATQAQARGYPYFIITSSANASRSGAFVTPTYTDSSISGSANCFGNSCFGSASGTSTTYGGQVFNYVKPGADIVVRFFREGEIDANRQGVWSAARVLAAQPKR